MATGHQSAQLGRGESAADLVTPEAIVIGLPIASVGTRAVAMIIDVTVQVVLAVAVVFAAGVANIGEAGWIGTVILLLVLFLVVFGYPVGFETFWRGRTPGKAVMGLRVVTVEAAPVTVRHAAVRAAIGLLDFWVTSGGAAVLSALFSPRGQRLGDLAAGTVVLRERTGAGRLEARGFNAPTGLEGYVRLVDTSGLNEDDYQAIRSALVRLPSLDPTAGVSLTAQVLGRVGPRVRPPLPAGVSPAAQLQCLAAAHQLRSARAPDSNAASDWIWHEPT